MAEITKHGVTGKPLQEYKSEIEAAYLAIDSAWNIDPDSPDGLQIAAWSEQLANLDEEVVNAYHSVDPNAAMGQGLNRIAAFSGIRRQAESYSTDTVEFEGEPRIEVPAGTKIRHRITGTLWETDSAIITDTSGKASIGVTCTTPGANGANPGTLTIIATPVARIHSVTNTTGASLGKAEESNNAFRYRRNQSVALPGNNQIDNIDAALKNLPGVKQVKIYENVDDDPDENGVFGHSMAIFVDGGEHDDIVRTIATHKNPGCGLNRKNVFPHKVSVNTVTPKGQPVNITYFRPELVTVYVETDVKTSSLTEVDKATIANALVDYSLVGFDETTGFAKNGFRIGESVSSGRLYTPVNFFVAADEYVSDMRLGISANDISHKVLTLAFNQLGVFSRENIKITYV